MQLLIDDPPEIKIVLRWKMMMLERSRSSDVSNFSVRNSGDKLCSLRTNGIIWNHVQPGPKNFEKKPWDKVHHDSLHLVAPCCTLLVGNLDLSQPWLVSSNHSNRNKLWIRNTWKIWKTRRKTNVSLVFLQFFLLFLCVAFWFKTHFRAWQRNLLVPMELRGLSHTVSVRFQFSVSWAAAPVVSCGILWYPVSCARAGSADSFSKAHQYRQMWLGLGQLDQFGVALDGCMFCLMLVFARLLDSTVETVWISSNLTKPSWSPCKDYIGLFISRVGTPSCHDVTRLGSICDSRIQQEQQQHAALPCTLQLTLGWDSDGTCMAYQYIYISMFIT